VIPGRPLRLDPYAAHRAASSYLSSAGARGTVSIAYNEVTVTVTDTYEPMFLGTIGIGTLRVDGTATAIAGHHHASPAATIRTATAAATGSRIEAQAIARGQERCSHSRPRRSTSTSALIGYPIVVWNAAG
jgi:hypothetical protein